MTAKANPDVAAALEEALMFDSVIILGVTTGQNYVKVISTAEYPPDILWALKSAEMQLMNVGVEFDD